MSSTIPSSLIKSIVYDVFEPLSCSDSLYVTWSLSKISSSINPEFLTRSKSIYPFMSLAVKSVSATVFLVTSSSLHVQKTFLFIFYDDRKVKEGLSGKDSVI